MWNAAICKKSLEETWYQEINRILEINLWVQLLEALEEGSPSINTTAKQMAEEIPMEIIGEVNTK